jgi:hypothetical protein
MEAATRRFVQSRAGHRCEYCRIHEDDEPYSFHVEHIVATKHGGDDNPTNLAWSCQHCNLGKSSNLSGWIEGQVVALFNPRRQRWQRHFRWRGSRLVTKT